MNNILKNQETIDYKDAFMKLYSDYISMCADYTYFFLQVEGSDYFEENTAKRLRLAKEALNVFEQEKNYEKLRLVYTAVDQFLKKDNNL